MRLILNVIWLVFGGLWLALGYLLAALICFVLIVTIPFGFASLRIASYALWPFGRTIVDKPGARHRRVDRQCHLAAVVRNLARNRAPGERGGDGGDDHRAAAGAGQSEADSGVAGASRQGDRSGGPPGAVGRAQLPAALKSVSQARSRDLRLIPVAACEISHITVWSQRGNGLIAKLLTCGNVRRLLGFVQTRDTRNAVSCRK